MAHTDPFALAIFVLGTTTASFVTGLAGFAFGLVAAAIWLYALTPVQTTTLIIAYGLLVQGYAVWKLRSGYLRSPSVPGLDGNSTANLTNVNFGSPYSFSSCFQEPRSQ